MGTKRREEEWEETCEHPQLISLFIISARNFPVKKLLWLTEGTGKGGGREVEVVVEGGNGWL